MGYVIAGYIGMESSWRLGLRRFPSVVTSASGDGGRKANQNFLHPVRECPTQPLRPSLILEVLPVLFFFLFILRQPKAPGEFQAHLLATHKGAASKSPGGTGTRFGLVGARRHHGTSTRKRGRRRNEGARARMRGRERGEGARGRTVT